MVCGLGLWPGVRAVRAFSLADALAASSAIGHLNANKARTQLQAALESAALAKAAHTTVSERRKICQDYLTQNLHGFDLAKLNSKIDISNGVITISAAYPFPASLMSLAGIDVMPIQPQAQVMGGRDINAEVVLVLDYSLSMLDDDKYISMRKAAADMIGKLVAGKGEATVKVSLVPFSAMVRASMAAAVVTQTASGPTWTGSTPDRKFPHNTGVKMPTSSNDTKWSHIEPHVQNNAPRNCPADLNKKVTNAPLTEDMAAIRSQLEDMRPIGFTNITL